MNYNLRVTGGEMFENPILEKETSTGKMSLYGNGLLLQEVKETKISVEDCLENIKVFKECHDFLKQRLILCSDSLLLKGTEIPAALKYFDEAEKFFRRSIILYTRGFSMNTFMDGILSVIRRVPKYKKITYLSTNVDDVVKEIEQTLTFDYAEDLWKKLKNPAKDCPLLWEYSKNGLESSWIKVSEKMGESDTALKNRWKEISDDIKSDNPQVVFSLLREWHYAGKPMNIDFVDFTEREVMQGKPMNDNGNEVNQ